jgi:hypothetical protein
LNLWSPSLIHLNHPNNIHIYSNKIWCSRLFPIRVHVLFWMPWTIGHHPIRISHSFCIYFLIWCPIVQIMPILLYVRPNAQNLHASFIPILNFTTSPQEKSNIILFPFCII